MLPPICFPSLGPSLQERVLFQFRLLMLLILCMAAGFFCTAAILHDRYFVNAGIAMALLFTFEFLRYVFVFRDQGKLRDFSRFISWCYLQPQTQMIGMVSMMLLAGMVQYYLQQKSGGLLSLIEQYGLVFETARSQPWRYIYGPFLHAGLAHWTINLGFLIIGAGLAFPLGRWQVVWALFFVGVFVPSITLAFLPHWVGSDAVLGVSGGVFALFGWVSGIALRNRREMPIGLWWMIAYFLIVIAVVSILVDYRSSWFCHFFGLVVGMAAGTLNIGVRPDLAASDRTVRPGAAQKAD